MKLNFVLGQSVNRKSDLYSVGIVLYEMLFGVCPFEDTNVENLIQKIEQTPLTFPLEKNPISNKTQSFLKEMLRPEPSKRLDWEKFFAFFEENLTYQPKHEYFNNDDTMRINVAATDNIKKSPVEEAPKTINNLGGFFYLYFYMKFFFRKFFRYQ